MEPDHMDPLYNRLNKKAEQNLLEVEDLLVTLRHPNPATADAMLQLAVRHAWSRSNVSEGERVAPLAMWAEVVSVFHREGLKGLISRGVSSDCRKEQGPFILAVLEEIRTEAALEAAVKVCGPLLHDPGEDPELAKECASVFNALLCFKPTVSASPDTAIAIRGFLHEIMRSFAKDADRVVAVLGLRAVGDASSLELLKSLPPFAPPWENVTATAVRAIRKKLKANKKGLDHTGDPPCGSPAGRP